MTKFYEVYKNVVDYQRTDVPLDSIQGIVIATGSHWLATIQQHPVRGIQLDPSGLVGVAAKQDSYARTQIAARLATPGLSLGDKAFALQTGVDAFANFHMPERLPIAEAYMAQLDALGDSAATWQFEAHETLLWTYYILGQSADVIRHGMCAMERINVMPFANRRLFYGQVNDHVYGPTTEALAGQPHAKARIAYLNQLIRSAAVPPGHLIAFDSTYDDLGRLSRREGERLIAGNANLGTQAAPLMGHYWLNRSIDIHLSSNTPASDVVSIPVTDGKIRVIEIGTISCPGCLLELYALERLKQRYPIIEPVMLTWTVGKVANRFIDAEEEVHHLTEFFKNTAKISYSVGIWAGKKVRNDDGGMMPEEPAYLEHTYPRFGKPMAWIVDGRGVIRRIFTGYDRDIEMQMRQTIEFLLHESTGAHPMVQGHPAMVRSLW